MKQFFLLLVLSLLFLFPTAGLSLSVSSGHMLDRFELIPDEKTPFLTFKGQKWRFLIRNQFEAVKHMTGTY